MRDITFRGFHIKKGGPITIVVDHEIVEGEWLYGDLQHNKSYACIFPEGSYTKFQDYLVIPATVGQFTGLCDANGRRIYEGDCIGHKLNAVEYLDDGFCVAGDRRLWSMKGLTVVGTRFDP